MGSVNPIISLQDRFSSLVDAKLRHEIVQKNGAIWNNRYEGDPKAGAVKIPVRDTEATVNDYKRSEGASLVEPVATFLTVTIDKDIAVNELMDGYEAGAVPDNILADRLDSAGYSLALRMNSDATDELVSGGTRIADGTALANTSIYNSFVDARKTLSKNKVPVSGRWALVSPDTYALLLKSSEFISASNLGDAVKQSGAVGQIAGFTVYEDTTLTEKTIKVSGVDYSIEYIVGHSDWCTRVEEWAVEPKVESLDGSGKYIGASAIQGRKIYTHRVTKKDAVLVKATEPVVTGVTVSPATATVAKETTETFEAVVDGYGAFDEDVTWSLAKGTKDVHEGTTVTNGVVTIGASQGAGTIKVVATSVGDTTKKGEAIITIPA